MILILDDDGVSAVDVDGIYTLGWFHFCRYQNLDDENAAPDFEASMRYFAGLQRVAPDLVDPNFLEVVRPLSESDEESRVTGHEVWHNFARVCMVSARPKRATAPRSAVMEEEMAIKAWMAALALAPEGDPARATYQEYIETFGIGLNVLRLSRQRI